MKLRVRPLKRKDVGSGLAAIDRRAMDELGVSSGEYVTIEGRDGRVVARVWPGRAEDTGSDVVRIDGQLRQEAGARIDDAVDEPDEAGRREIFAVHTRERPLADDVDLDDLAERTDGFVGADIEAVCREAATIAVREYVDAGEEDADVEGIVLTADHFDSALEEVDPQGTETFGTDDVASLGEGGAVGDL